MLRPSGSQPFLDSGTDKMPAGFPMTGLTLHSTNDSTHYLLLERSNAFIYSTKKCKAVCGDEVEKPR